MSEFDPSRRLQREERLREILKVDPRTNRLYKDREGWKSRQKEAAKRINHFKAILQEQRKERREAQKKLTSIKAAVRTTENRIKHHSRRKEFCRKKLLGVRSKLAARRTQIMHDLQGIMLKNAYREIGLPIPKKLERIKNLSIFKEKTDGED